MKREIKFKYYWQHDVNKSIESKILTLDEIESAMFRFQLGRPAYTTKWDLIRTCQSLDLGDKAAIEMFEGDIVEYSILDHQLRPRKWILEIRWNRWCWALYEKGKYFTSMDSATRNNCRVIGNIFDNPELLESEV